MGAGVSSLAAARHMPAPVMEARHFLVTGYSNVTGSHFAAGSYRAVTGAVSRVAFGVGGTGQQAILLPLFPEVFPRDAENVGCALYVAIGRVQGEANVFALRFSEREPPRQLEVVRGRPGAGPAVDLTERRQVGPCQVRPIAEDHGPLDHVAELSHVPRPVPGLEGLERRRVERLDPLFELAVERLAKVVGEEWNVALNFSQRGQGDGGDGDPIVEIGPELAGVHVLFQVAVGGRDEAQADLDLVSAAEPAKAPALKEIEHLGLHFRAELRDFVEEQGTAVGHLDESALA